MKRRVFFIDPNSYNNLQIYDDNLLNEVNKNNEFELFFFGSNLYKRKSKLVFKLKLIYNYNSKVGIKKIYSYLLSQLVLFFNVLYYKPDVIHFQWIKIYKFDYLFIKILNLIFPDLRIYYTAHNLLPHDSGEKYFHFFKKFYRIVHKIIVHTEDSKIRLIEEFKIDSDKIEVIPHGLLSYDSSEKKQNNFCFIKDSNKIVFAIIGKLSSYKGVDLIIESWNTKYSNRKDLELVFAGKSNIDILGSLNNSINTKFINRFLTDDEFIEIIRYADVILLPYREISQSGVLLTVLNEKKVLLVSNHKSLMEPFKFGKIGWIMNDLSTDSLIDTIDIAISEIKEGFNVSNTIWDEIHNYYSWSEIGNKTKILYNDI